MGASIESELELRHQATGKYGARTIDKLLPRYRCRSCGSELVSPSVVVVAHSPYHDVKSLARHAKELATATRSQPAPPICARCQSPATLEVVDYHAYHSGAGKDLVVRTFAPAGLLRSSRQELLWWSPAAGHQPIEHLDRAAEATLRTDAAIREAAATLELSGPLAAAPFIQRALAEAPGNPALMEFIAPLLREGKAGLAGAIADAHVEVHPDAPEAHFWLAEIAIQVVAHGAWPIEQLAEADTHLDRALALKAAFPEAEIARCNVLRMRGDEAGARACFAEVLTKYPGEAAPHFNLGVMVLESDPQAALDHFTRGEALAPDDVDYPLGRARALVRLGRAEEARQALARARGLDPEHPRIAEVESSLS